MSDAQPARPSRNPVPQPRCDFCFCTLDDQAFLFRSPIGAMPACICDACVAERWAWLEMDRRSPGFLAGVIAIQKAKIAARWVESHPGAREVPL